MSHVPINDVLAIAQLFLQFQAVGREVTVPNRQAKENNAEHSFMLQTMALYIIEVLGLSLCTKKVLLYSMFHDYPEVDEGDCHIFDEEARAGKYEREERAIERLQCDFPRFTTMHHAIHHYRLQADDEARFVHALDKLMPMIVIYLSGGGTWQELGFSRQATLLKKRETTADCPIVFDLAVQLEAMILVQPELFAQD